MTVAFATAQPEAPTAAVPVTADELVAEAIRCIITGRPFPEHLRAKSPLSPGLESVHHRIAHILSGPSGL